MSEEAAKKRKASDIDAEIAQVKKELEDARGTDCEVYARIVGYYRSVRNWNKGKREEYKERKMFTENPQETASRLEAARKKASEPLKECKHPEFAWKCPNNRAGGCARPAEICFVDAGLGASVMGSSEMCSCGNETAPGAHKQTG